MGVTGAGLYSSDFAADLRSMIAAVSKLPVDSGKRLEIICQTEPRAASDPSDADHTTFWLVVADQFHKHGIVCLDATTKALAIIESGADEQLMRQLGMSPSILKKRTANLAQLAAQLKQPSECSNSKTLKGPQPLLYEAGEVLLYPTSKGRPINPYMNETQLAKTDWKQDGWSTMIIIECGRVFDYLAWYRAITLTQALIAPPELTTLVDKEWQLASPGTLSKLHAQRMKITSLAKVVLCPEQLGLLACHFSSPVANTVIDRSICNEMVVTPASQEAAPLPSRKTRRKVIDNLRALLA